MRHMCKLSEFRFHLTSLESDEGSFVVHLVTIVRRAEDCNDSPSFLELIALVLDFMRPDHILEPIRIAESLRDIWPEHKSYTSLRRMSTIHVGGVTPQCLTKNTSISRLSESIDLPDVIKFHVII